MGLEPLVDKFKAFGYVVKTADGNNVADLADVLDQVPFEKGKPSLILADTVKGCGISYIANKVNWHHHVPTDEEFTLAMNELETARTQLLETGEPQLAGVA
jgi:transketolase